VADSARDFPSLHPFIPAIAARREQHQLEQNAPALVTLDNAPAHHFDRMEDLMAQQAIQIHWLPPHSTHLTQPLDLAIFGSKIFELWFKRLYRGTVTATNQLESALARNLLMSSIHGMRRR
jgi:hypothetical protein